MGHGQSSLEAMSKVSMHTAMANFNRLCERNVSKVHDLRGFEDVFGSYPQGLDAVFRVYPDCEANFFTEVFPFIVQSASRMYPEYNLKKLQQGAVDHLMLGRELVVTLLAHMFLCTITDSARDMPYPCFDMLLFRVSTRQPQELAKLRMVIHYFDRCRLETPQGELRIYRQVRDRGRASWRDSRQPLLEMQVAPELTGFEDEVGRGCLHADFANKSLGGGVLVGGCVQEEIRFAICPELCAAMLVCPIMLENEAITIVGGEQFCTYTGYARSLAFGGDYRDPSPRDADGTPLVAITAMDALDFRGEDSSLRRQMQEPLMLRELEKAAAAFAPVDDQALHQWPVIATGNWGCGAFEGCPELKAVLQWLAASEGRRSLLYFPFELKIGPELVQLSHDFCQAGVTVGELYTALVTEPKPREGPEIFYSLRTKLLR